MDIEDDIEQNVDDCDRTLPLSSSEEDIEDDIVRKYTKSGVQSKVEEEEDLEQIHTVSALTAYTFSYVLCTLFIIGCIASFGLLMLVCKWYPSLQLYLTHWKCKQLKHATSILVKSVSGDLTVCEVKDVKFYINKRFVTVRMYMYRHACFIYDRHLNTFVRVEYNSNFSFPYIHANMKMPISNTVRLIREKLFGRNEIRVPVKSVIQLMIDEVLHPFYIFQVISCIIWYADEYFVYATVIIVTSSISAILGLIETRSNMIKLRKMAVFECQVNKVIKANVVRSSSGNQLEYVFMKVSSTDLVPGDIVEIEDGCVLPCDIMLISGQCIVNEAMLTGESIPIVKNAIPTQGSNTELYSVNNHKNYTLYSGTEVMQTRLFGGDKVLGICMRTGFDTAKGKLMLSILYPKPTQFKFYQDSFKFIGVMFILGFIGIIYSAIRLKQKGVTAFAICLRALDVITIAVPPSLPIAMTVGVGFAIARLKVKNIFCISPPRVNVSGKINCMCFDKTGTLTEEGLDLFGVRTLVTSSNGPSFNEMIHAEEVQETLCNLDTTETSDNNTLLLHAMASCHSLTYVRRELVGDPLEQKIFQATQWCLKEPSHVGEESAITAIVHPPVTNEKDDDFESFTTSNKDLPLELGILRRFDFSSALQRMSVITKNLQTSETMVFVKGSPEAIAKLSSKESLPSDFESVLYSYAHQGFRVLACGYKKMDHNFDWRKAQKVQREDIESNLTFLGLIVMQNRMKSDTPSIIRKLNRSNIESIMVTGDNAFTAISVARQCGIVPNDMTIYFGEVKQDSNGANTTVTWRDIESEATLDPITLLPSDGSNIGHYELAITGSVFEHLLTEHNSFMKRREEELERFKLDKVSKPKDWNDRHSTFERMLVMSHIYSRMSPDQKLILSEQLQKLGYFVGFCGDGANDCGALKASHIGISLSEAEASIAAPFTSTRPTIACVPTVITEGRAALQTSFQMFKYVACCSMIQFFTVIILYETNSTLGDYQFLFADLGLVLPTVLLMSRTSARSKLIKQKPVGSLINRVVLLSLFAQLFLSFGFQIFAFWLVRQQPFYSPIVPRPDTKENIHCFETTVLFTLSMYQTLACALSYSISKPFKRPIYTNKLYSVALLFVLGLLAYVTLDPGVYTRYWLEFVDIPVYFRYLILLIAAVHLLLSFTFERFFIAGSGVTIIKMISLRKMLSGVKYILVQLGIISGISSHPAVTAKLMRSRKKYNILKRQYLEDYIRF